MPRGRRSTSARLRCSMTATLSTERAWAMSMTRSPDRYLSTISCLVRAGSLRWPVAKADGAEVTAPQRRVPPLSDHQLDESSRFDWSKSVGAPPVRRPGPYGQGLRRRGGRVAVVTTLRSPPSLHPRRSRPGCGPASITHRRRTALSRQALGGQTRGVPTHRARNTGAAEAGAAGPVRPTQ